MNLSKSNDPRFWEKWRDAGAVESYWLAEDRKIAALRKIHGDVAVVRKHNGQLILDDPVAIGFIQAVEQHNGKHNCRNTFELNADRITHFKNRLAERGMTASEAVIVVLNVDDIHGGPLADALMPGYNWQEIRDQGEIPFARGLAGRDGIQDILGDFDKEAAAKLQGMRNVAVVVVDHGVAEVFAA